MERQQQIKKILIILVAVGLFALSYYYYGAREPKKPVVAANDAVQVVESAETTQLAPTTTPSAADNKQSAATEPAETVPSAEQKPVIVEVEPVSPASEKIKPSDRSSLISAALSSAGKADPFALGRSAFAPIRSASSAGSLPSFDLPGLDELPPPPDFAGAEPEKQEVSAEDRIQIKGFLGNKVIAEVDGITDSLAAGDKLGGVKVLSVDPTGLAGKFLVDGKTVTKKLPPIVSTSGSIELKHTVNLQPLE